MLAHPFRAVATPPEAEAVRAAVGAPAAGVAWVRGDQEALSVAGRRAIGHDEPVAEDDLWHLGSVTKSMTAVLAARLVERGVLSFEDRLDAHLGDMPNLDAALAGATLADLLHHRSGVQPNVENDVAIELRTAESTVGTVVQRRRYLEAALGSKGGERGAFLYSNAGYVAAAAMMETATGRAWEELIADDLFAPLRLSSASFGPPGSSVATPDQPWGHAKSGGTRAYPPAPASDNIVALNPAGRVHMSLSDFLTYLKAHADRSPLLTPESWDRLHRPVTDRDARYAMGWVAPAKGVRMHSGSNTIWFATGGFNDSGGAMAIVTNIGNGANLPGPVEQPVLDFLSDV